MTCHSDRSFLFPFMASSNRESGDCHAFAALAGFSGLVGCDEGAGVQKFAGEFAERACAFAVNDTNVGQTRHHGAVEIFFECVHCIVGAHSAQMHFHPR